MNGQSVNLVRDRTAVESSEGSEFVQCKRQALQHSRRLRMSSMAESPTDPGSVDKDVGSEEAHDELIRDNDCTTVEEEAGGVEDIKMFWCRCGGQKFLCGPNGRRRTCRQRYNEMEEIKSKLGTRFQHCVRLPSRDRLEIHGYTGMWGTNRHILMGYDVRVCCVENDEGEKYTSLEYASSRGCPSDGDPSNGEMLAQQDPARQCGIDGCVREEFVTTRDLLSFVPESQECFAYPGAFRCVNRVPLIQHRMKKYLARRSFTFRDVAKLGEFFKFPEDMTLQTLNATKGMRAFFRKENTEFMSGIPETKGHVLLRKAPTREMLLRSVYYLLKDLQLYREADDMPVRLIVALDRWKLEDGMGDLPDVEPFRNLRLAAESLQKCETSGAHLLCAPVKDDDEETAS